jgi:hypothetical protein
MSIPIVRSVVVVLGSALAVCACAHEQSVEPGVAEPGVVVTTAALVSNDSAVIEVAKARCRRLDECNNLGGGKDYVDRAQCLTAYLQPDSNIEMLRSCPDGVDKARLNVCLATLVDQHCQSDMGPVTAMTDCDSYCAKVTVAR